MEALQKPKGSTLADLFKPLEPVAAQPETAPISQPNNPIGAGGPAAPGSAASANGTVTAEQALSGLRHTEIASTTLTGAPGQPGVTPLTGASPSATVSLGGMVQGEWAVNIMDALLPAAMVAGFYAMGMKLRKSELQLTASEKATISPIMQKCLDSILLNFNNPWNALAITVGAIYGGKLMEKGLIGWIDKKQEQQQDEALEEKIKQAEKSSDPAKFDYANQSAADIQNGNVVTPGSAWPFTEEDIQQRMKKGKCSRIRAIEWLKKKHNVK